uniref:Uncharacterized protein n=1 Tax=Anguilla anguilla TaxID=7936 RepID=A0A0E9SD52_ANGAN
MVQYSSYPMLIVCCCFSAF